MFSGYLNFLFVVVMLLHGKCFLKGIFKHLLGNQRPRRYNMCHNLSMRKANNTLEDSMMETSENLQYIECKYQFGFSVIVVVSYPIIFCIPSQHFYNLGLPLRYFSLLLLLYIKEMVVVLLRPVCLCMAYLVKSVKNFTLSYQSSEHPFEIER